MGDEMAMGVGGAERVSIDTVAVQGAAEVLARLAEEVRGVAVAGDGNVPPVPRDHGDLAALVAELDDGRVAFDQRLTGLLDGMADAALVQVFAVSADDPTRPALGLPEAAR